MTSVAERPKTRPLSAIAKAARLVDIATHADDTGATIHSIGVAGAFLWAQPEAPDVVDVVKIHTDGPGLLALADHMQLPITTVHGLAYASGFVGMLELPVQVMAGLTETLAAALVTA